MLLEAFRRGGQISQVVGFAAVREGAEIFAAIAAGDGYATDATLLCQSYPFPFGEYPAVRKLIAGNFAVFADQPGDGLGILVGNGIHNVNVGRQVADSAVFLFHRGTSFLAHARGILKKCSQLVCSLRIALCGRRNTQYGFFQNKDVSKKNRREAKEMKSDVKVCIAFFRKISYNQFV